MVYGFYVGKYLRKNPFVVGNPLLLSGVVLTGLVTAGYLAISKQVHNVTNPG